MVLYAQANVQWLWRVGEAISLNQRTADNECCGADNDPSLPEITGTIACISLKNSVSGFATHISGSAPVGSGAFFDRFIIWQSRRVQNLVWNGLLMGRILCVLHLSSARLPKSTNQTFGRTSCRR